MSDRPNTAELSTIESRYMRMGDRIVVEPADGQDFEATVLACHGWGLIHGVMDWQMQRDDGETFTYGIHISAPVKVVSR